MKYKYTRKSIWWILEDYKEAKNITPSEYARIQQVQKDLLAQKEDRKEHAYFTSPIFHEKTITTPSPLELPKINNNFSSMEQYNWAKQITDEVNKLYQFIKEKL